MPDFPPPDAPSHAGWDAVHKKVAAGEAKYRAERMAIAIECRHLRIFTHRLGQGIRTQSNVVSAYKPRPPRKYNFALIIGFIHRLDAIDFIKEARAKRAENIKRTQEKRMEMEHET